MDGRGDGGTSRRLGLRMGVDRGEEERRRGCNGMILVIN